MIKVEALSVQGRIFWNLYGLGQNYVFNVLGFGKKAGQNQNKNTLGAFGRLDGLKKLALAAIYNQGGPPTLADSGRVYTLLSDNAWHRPVSADFDAHWIVKGFRKWVFILKRIDIIWEKLGPRKGF